jgi:hypothetical protein
MKQSRLKRTTFQYAGAVIFAVVFNQIYSLFAHGVSSVYMTWLFLPLLIFGLLPAVMLERYGYSATKTKAYAFFHRFYHTGVATVTVGTLLQGIVEIAGTGSKYIMFYWLVGFTVIVIGTLRLMPVLFRKA